MGKDNDNDMRGLSELEINEINAEIAHAPYRSSVAIEALKIVQKQRRWVSDNSLIAIAEHLEMSAEELEGIATFYNHIYRRPVGEKIILFCNSVSCWIRDSDGLEAHICSRLGVGPGETTPDDAYTFIPVPCLGACDRAPVMMVGDDLHQDLDQDKIDGILPALANESLVNRGDDQR
jgi:NADH-quinone oxidoreductase subunit E